MQLLIENTYENGQTDGMKLYKAKNGDFIFATTKADAKMKQKARLTTPYLAVKSYAQKAINL